MDKQKRLEQILKGFSDVRIAVIGDFIADFFLFGQTKRLSREAPVLVLEFLKEKIFLGGGANAIHNVNALGAKAIPIGVLGKDAAGGAVLSAFRDLGLDTRFVFEDAGRETVTIQRIVGSGVHTTFQQILRIDRGGRVPLTSPLENQVREALFEALGEADVLIVSDYGYGVITPGLIEDINRIAGEGRVRVMVDSRYRFSEFRNAHTMAPNEPETQEAAGIPLRNLADVRLAAAKLLGESKAENLLVTRGHQGIALFGKSGGETVIPIFGSDEISDVTGAGDTVIAAYASAIGAGADAVEATVLANVAGGLVVMKSGTAVVDSGEILEAVSREDTWPAS